MHRDNGAHEPAEGPPALASQIQQHSRVTPAGFAGTLKQPNFLGYLNQQYLYYVCVKISVLEDSVLHHLQFS